MTRSPAPAPPPDGDGTPGAGSGTSDSGGGSSDAGSETPGDDGRQGPSPARRRHLVGALLGLAAGVVALDQATKQVVLANLGDGDRLSIIGDLLSLRLVYNPGAAFSFASGTTWVFTVIAAVVVLVILRVSRRIGSAGWAVALGLLLGGATGNLLDRLFRPPGVGVGHVVDFIDYAGFFVGNVADIAIVSAAALVMLLTLQGRAVDGSHHAHRDDPEATGGAPGAIGTDPQALGGSTKAHGGAPEADRGVPDAPGRDAPERDA